MLSMLVLLVALGQGTPPLEPDPARDKALDDSILQFLDGKRSDVEMERDLRKYAAEFEAHPYKVGFARIDWEKAPQERFMRFTRMNFKLMQPAIDAYFKGDLTSAAAGRKVAPFFLLFNGWGMDPPPGADATWTQRRDELFAQFRQYWALER